MALLDNMFPYIAYISKFEKLFITVIQKNNIARNKDMHRFTMTSIIIIAFLNLNFLFLINTQIISMCDTLDEDNSLLKSRRIRALCDALQSSQDISDIEESDLIPDFDLTQIETGNIY